LLSSTPIEAEDPLEISFAVVRRLTKEFNGFDCSAAEMYFVNVRGSLEIF